MKVLTKRDLIKDIITAWERQFGVEPEKPRWRSVLNQLRQLNLSTASAEEVEGIIGNRTWTRLQCIECHRESESAMQLGEDLECEGVAPCICPSCLRGAFSELAEVETETILRIAC